MILLAMVLGRQTRGRMREAIGNPSPDIFWLLCWSLGGLMVMSLVPSKRVDRIFPIVPPLCLLLGAQVARGLAAERMRRRVYQWSAAALLCSFLFTTGYTVWKVVPGYAYHRDALVTFSQAVRRQAAACHWRYEVVSSRDVAGTGGMLLYLQVTFHPVNQASERAD